MPTLEQIQAKLKKLQAQADVLIARKAQAAVDQIRELMIKHGLTTADIEAKAKAKRAAHALNGRAASGKSKAAGAGKSIPKYRDNKTGATWTGHGRAPAWIAAVKDRTLFLIEGAGELKSASKASVTRAKAGKKGQPKGAQPPKYLNPETGATWSGRGPAPAWLASVKDRSRFLIDSAAATSTVAAKKGVTAKKAAASRTVAKKGAAATKKATARKSVGRPAVKKAAAKKTAVKKTAAVKKAPGRKLGSKRKAGTTSAAAAPQSSTVHAGA
ncbi:DNA-binding protein H-NS [Paraburkholderia sp. BL23I1N1]|uniref:H-NS family nucleoid-associated regulatory protein n=1 Tax=Paraburkholderia sp. BL23I1N1 TaxID=1938802 RepID=UPI000E74375A|nr:H-NS family nucleoid-associated regulatory protein [Paraburkholderia sp. BL23I1N1]RKE38107.1 DNA-binding protein H-NS [Paraburkholderia sp. BL23I1N1]